MKRAGDVKLELAKHASKAQALVQAGFFKIGKGQYAEGDIFIGVTVPQQRQVAKKFAGLPMAEIQELLRSNIHEHRLTALLILQHAELSAAAKFMLKNLAHINSWDLVDTAAPGILGAYLMKNPRERKILYKLVKSKNLWERRVAIVATYPLIRAGQLDDTVAIAELLLHDEHDLMHKATGWMLREVGKKSEATLKKFLGKHAKEMPRTMLRYSIERMPPGDKKRYMAT